MNPRGAERSIGIERRAKAISNELKTNVLGALEYLGEGFLYYQRNHGAELEAWRQRKAPSLSAKKFLTSSSLIEDIYHESLTLIYRLLFLFYAESRGLLPLRNDHNRKCYSLEAIRDEIITRLDDPNEKRNIFSKSETALWDWLGKLVHHVNESGQKRERLLPANSGGLFDSEMHEFLGMFKIGDYYLAHAIDLLSRTRPGLRRGGVRQMKVNYRDLDIRHLGSIYEGILEYHACIADNDLAIIESITGYNKGLKYKAVTELTATETQQLARYLEAHKKHLNDPFLPRGCKVKGFKAEGQYYLVYGGRESKRKSSGSYYTPDNIVQYIIENTLGPLVRGECRLPEPGMLRTGERGSATEQQQLPAGSQPLSANEILNLKVLDPAMGSGHFLGAAIEYLAKAYRSAVLRENGDHGKVISEAGFSWYKRLVAERCIYGVDIDPFAVELAKLTIWINTMDRSMPLSFLDHHLKRGNALIGCQVGDPASLTLKNDSEDRNAFHWEMEFPEVFLDKERCNADKRGFDAIIGNPPYVRIQNMNGRAEIDTDFYKLNYTSASKGSYDLYVVFIDLNLRLLNREGRAGLITSNKFFNAKYGEPLRNLLSKGQHLSHIVHFGDQQLFEGASTYTCLLFLNKSASAECHFVEVSDLSKWSVNGDSTERLIPAAKFTSAEWCHNTGPASELLEKLSDWPVKLSQVVNRIFQGAITSADTVFLFKEYKLAGDSSRCEVFSPESDFWVELESSILKPVVRSGRVSHYHAEPSALVLFPYEVWNSSARLYTESEMKRLFPLAWDYLNINKKLLENREKSKFRDEEWYRFGRRQNLGLWEQPKLMIPYMVNELSAYLDMADNYYFINVTTGGYGIIADESAGSLAYLCGLLNSRLLNFFLQNKSTNFRGGYFAANKQYLEGLPIYPINFSERKDKVIHDQMVRLVEQIQYLRRQLPLARDQHFDVNKRKIDALADQIDRLVYKLYELTDEQIAILEATGS
jgi:Eco57I restriction-modification methylase/TaqI-like C-terminal specificity domain